MSDSALRELFCQADKTMELLRRVNPSLANEDALSTDKLTNKIRKFHDLWQELTASIPTAWKLDPLDRQSTDRLSVDMSIPIDTYM